MSKPAIVVVGSSNMDLVAKSQRIPMTGDTLGAQSSMQHIKEVEDMFGISK